MAIEVRILDETSSSFAHFATNPLVSAGQPTLEFHGTNRVLLNAELAKTVLGVYLQDNPETVLRGKQDVEKALKRGLQSLLQSALKVASKKQGKMDAQASTLLERHYPNLMS